jgi:hypothetical protein
MRRALGVLGFAILVAVGTAVAGWWIVPLLAAIRVRVTPRDPMPTVTSMLGAALGWALMLGLGALTGPVASVARRAAGAMGLPAWKLVLATLLFPALLAGTAALGAKSASPR